MNRLFGILIICLSLLTSAVILQISMTDVRSLPTMTVVLVLVVFLIGLALLIPDGGNTENEPEYTNEEIEKELEEFNKMT